MEYIPSSESSFDKSTVESWLSRLSIDYIHDTGWVEVNKRFNSIAKGCRTFALDQYPVQPDKRTDFINGVTFGLLALAHTSDIAKIKQLFDNPGQVDQIPEARGSVLPKFMSGDPGAGA